MGVYIPNVSKPKSCRECPAHSFTFGDEYVWAHDSCGVLKKWFNVKKIDIDPFKEILPDCSIIDIVTCRECKYGILEDDEDIYRCEYNGSVWNEGNHFCSYGERRNNESDA